MNKTWGDMTATWGSLTDGWGSARTDGAGMPPKAKAGAIRPKVVRAAQTPRPGVVR